MATVPFRPINNVVEEGFDQNFWIGFLSAAWKRSELVSLFPLLQRPIGPLRLWYISLLFFNVLYNRNRFIKKTFEGFNNSSYFQCLVDSLLSNTASPDLSRLVYALLGTRVSDRHRAGCERCLQTEWQRLTRSTHCTHPLAWPPAQAMLRLLTFT